ncbi:hypothetical protein [Chroococcus sp. FPU101]|uniref:hypothetical protein n=1 Tax=Chroococcus sp. FPU101 TaxID=1974212 RepID=UPI001A8F8619|nr:hypothetical protein [Chroococcus sp. FPU101]GFE69056.1 hypothetical protein CFPU101_16660 [Chroococcus sp. FPU101]
MRINNPELKFLLPFTLAIGAFSLFFWSSSRYSLYHDKLREMSLIKGAKCSLILDSYLTSQGEKELQFFQSKALACLDKITFPESEIAYRQLQAGERTLLIKELQQDLVFWVEQPLYRAILKGYIPAMLGACLFILLANPINFDEFNQLN